MTGFQWFAIGIMIFCVLYGTKIWFEAQNDKSDPNYGQCVASAIWAYVMALYVFLYAFYDSWA